MTTNMTTMKKQPKTTILIDGLTTGKQDYLSFTYRTKLIDTETLRLRQPDGIYNYRHHLNYDDLTKLGTTYPTIYTFDQSKKMTGKDLTPDIHEKLLKYNLSQLIITHQLDTDKITYHWTGDHLPQPNLEKTQTQTQTQTILEGIQ